MNVEELLNVARVSFEPYMLQDVRVLHCEFRIVPGASGSPRLGTGDHFVTRDGDALRARFTVALAVHTDDENPLGAELRAGMEVVYTRSPGEDQAPEAQVDVAARINSVFHAWPFVRELVDSCLRRLGLPGLMLPIMQPIHAVELSGVEVSKNEAP